MRKLLLLVVLFFCSQAWGTITCADGATGCTVTTARNCATVSSVGTCTITIGSTASGSTGVVCYAGPTAANTFTVTGGGTWTTSAASHEGANSTVGTVECAYNLNMTGATTSLTCTFSANGVSQQCQYLNFTHTSATVTFDTAGIVNDSVACTTACAGVALTLGTANNYILIQTSAGTGTLSAINQSYTGTFLNGDGTAYKINVTVVGTTPNWTSTSGQVIGGAIAIYETPAGGVVRHRASVTQK